MRHIEKRANRFYAVLTVPTDVRHIVGKLRFVKSLQTASKAEAQLRVAVAVAGWQAVIAKARGTLPCPKDDFWASLRRDFTGAKDEGARLVVEDIIEAAAQRISDPEEGALRYRIATEQAPELIPLGPLVAAWKESLRGRAQKSIDQAHRDVSKMADHFKHLEALAPQRVNAWLDKLRGEGMTASSFERIGKGCRSFWLYLQESGTRSVIDADPFTGPFRLAQRTAVRNTVNRLGYSPQELADLYAAALVKGDQPLADLIALGAYSGARIEELCKFTKETAQGGMLRMGTKTEASERECPVHPAVAPLVARLMADSQDGFLIPSTAANQYDNRSGPLSQRFGHLKTAAGFGKRHTFHGIRKNVATQLEQAGVPEGVAADILGHEKATMSYGLYSAGSSMEQKAKALALVQYPGKLAEPA